MNIGMLSSWFTRETRCLTPLFFARETTMRFIASSLMVVASTSAFFTSDSSRVSSCVASAFMATASYFLATSSHFSWFLSMTITLLFCFLSFNAISVKR